MKHSKTQSLITFTVVILILGLIFTTQCGYSETEHMKKNKVREFLKSGKIKIANALRKST